MAQIDTRYLKTDSSKKPNSNGKSDLIANRKGGIFLIICSLIGLSMDAVSLVNVLNGNSTHDLFGVLFWMCLGVGLIVWGIIMIANDPKPRKEG